MGWQFLRAHSGVILLIGGYLKSKVKRIIGADRTEYLLFFPEVQWSFEYRQTVRIFINSLLYIYIRGATNIFLGVYRREAQKTLRRKDEVTVKINAPFVAFNFINCCISHLFNFPSAFSFYWSSTWCFFPSLSSQEPPEEKKKVFIWSTMCCWGLIRLAIKSISDSKGHN